MDNSYNQITREHVIKSVVRKHHREIHAARKEGKSIYISRFEMNRAMEVKNLLNKPLFRRVRGGTQTRLIKEGESKDIARTRLRKVE